MNASLGITGYAIKDNTIYLLIQESMKPTWVAYRTLMESSVSLAYKTQVNLFVADLVRKQLPDMLDDPTS